MPMLNGMDCLLVSMYNPHILFTDIIITFYKVACVANTGIHNFCLTKAKKRPQHTRPLTRNNTHVHYSTERLFVSIVFNYYFRVLSTMCFTY